MRSWSVPVMVVFWLVLAFSLAPFHHWSIPPSQPSPGVPDAWKLWRHPFVAGWALLLVLAQLVLLIRVKADGKRPRARRKLWPVVAAAAWCLGLLASGLCIALSMAIAGDDSFEVVGGTLEAMERLLPGLAAGKWLFPVLLVGFLLGWWALWWVALWRTVRTDDPEAHVARFFRWILAGSVLELLVAVPCHIITRRRDDCCAPHLTFWGMATGWALLLMSLGPAVILLVEERMARKKRAAG